MASFLRPGYRRSGRSNLRWFTVQVWLRSGLMVQADTVATRTTDVVELVTIPIPTRGSSVPYQADSNSPSIEPNCMRLLERLKSVHPMKW
eukprot:1139504-Amphidinium_carterae.1